MILDILKIITSHPFVILLVRVW